MGIVHFENVKVTTMTVIVDIVGSAIIEAAFPLLPISKLELKNTVKSSKKFKIPWPGKQHAGAIFSTKFSGITRGIVKSSKGKSFRNSVVIDICTSGKNVSAKLSKNKIHMCGPDSPEIAMETARHIINHLLKMQKELDYISAHLTERDQTMEWLLSVTGGDNFIINAETQEIVQLAPGETIKNKLVYDTSGNVKYYYREVPFDWEDGDSVNPEGIIVNKYGQPYYRSLTKREKKEGVLSYPIMKIGNTVRMKLLDGTREFPVDDKANKFNKVCRFPLTLMEVTSLKYPEVFLQNLEDGQNHYPENVDPKIANFLISYIQDYTYHHVFEGFLENVKETDRVYVNDELEIKKPENSKPFENEHREIIPLSLGEMNIAMINYSYSLLMNVDRQTLTQLIDGYEKNGNVWTAVYNNTIDHHVTITVPYIVSETETIKRKESRSISWMVYKSGIVTQSGPSPALMRDVYYDFMEFVNLNRAQICLKDDKPFSIKYKSYPSDL